MQEFESLGISPTVCILGDGALLAVEAAMAGFTVIKMESSSCGKAATTSFLVANGCTSKTLQ